MEYTENLNLKKPGGMDNANIGDINDNMDSLDEAITLHSENENNPHNVTKTQIGLGNVDNTSDANKPISSATQAALDTKAETSEIVAKRDFTTEGDKVKSLSLDGSSYNFAGGMLPQLHISVETGSTVVAACGSNTYTATSINGVADIQVSDYGTYSIVASKSGTSASTSINVDSVKRYDISLSYYELYGFHVNTSESNPASAVTYIEDAIGKTPAYMNYSSNSFNYGDWADAFFMPQPCMVKYDGTVDYYLDINNYGLKADGTASDVANTSYAGNAMMEWPQIWLKYTTDSTGYNVYICSKKLDNDYHAYSNINSANQLIDNFYTPIYNGSNISNKLRSISGQTPINTQTAATEITYALNNNINSGQVEWYTEVFSDVMTINNLLVLIGKSLNTQAVFGNGYYTGGSSSSNPRIATGTMNTKGLFWGSNGSSVVGVKVFGMEHWWGNQWRRYAGHINANGTQKIKLTYGNADGSSATSYNTDGSGYITISGATPNGSSGGYISGVKATQYGIIPVTASGTDSTYYCDGLWFNNSQNNYAFRGGACDNGLPVGAFCCNLHNAASYSGWAIGAAPSLKPLL